MDRAFAILSFITIVVSSFCGLTIVEKKLLDSKGDASVRTPEKGSSVTSLNKHSLIIINEIEWIFNFNFANQLLYVFNRSSVE